MLSTRLRRLAAAAALALSALTVAALSTGVTAGSGSLAIRDCTSGTCSDPTNSFTGDTLVLMADGAAKRIADITAGDQIAATDPRTGLTTTQPVVATVTGTGSKKLVGITFGGATLTATVNHRFWVANRGGWHTAAELAVGDRLGDRGDLRVTGLQPVTRQATVYNLDVAGPQTFIVLAGGRQVLVHE